VPRRHAEDRRCHRKWVVGERWEPEIVRANEAAMREQPLTGHVDLPLQVGQQVGLGRRIGVEVDRQPVRVNPVEQ